MSNWRRICALCLALAMALSLAACGGGSAPAASSEREDAAASEAARSAPGGESSEETEAPDREAEKNGDVAILFTSDVHCGVDQGFGYVGLQQVRSTLEARGCTTLLVDDGDAVQGENLGTLSKGESVIALMNELHYDVAIPGNHEFDYGMDQFFKLTEQAQFPYISCNFFKEGELVFEPYVIKEAAGKKIAFVGITTPLSIMVGTQQYFQNESGEFIYSFMQEDGPEAFYQQVQKSVDEAREAGADYVYVMGHMGNQETYQPWTYANVIEHTNGIDVFLDGHSHDTEQVVMKNKDGEDVVRSACGTKLNCIGYSIISGEDGSIETNIYSWPNKESAPDLLGLDNEIGQRIRQAKADSEELLSQVVAKSQVELTENDPEAKDESGNPVRMIRRADTNLGDFCADAFRVQSGADVGIVNGGCIRKSISKGDVTMGDLLNLFPYGNELTVLEVTGQQILDALEWGARSVPEECGGFLQVSGMSYEVDVSVESGCQEDERQMYSGIEGERRVKNVRVGGEPLEADKTYTLAGPNYTLLSHGDGFTVFDDAKVISEGQKLDLQMLQDYITDDLGGVIGEQYADPYGDGRIVILQEDDADQK